MEEILQRGFKPSVEHTAVLFICVAIGVLASWWIALIPAIVMLVVAQRKSGSAHFDDNWEPAPRCDFHVMAIKPSGGDLFAWPGTGEFLFELASQSHYQPALRALAGDQGKAGKNAEYQATLVIDNEAQDHKAVRVEISGVVVGFFGAREARSFLDRLEVMKMAGQRTACAARICGGRGSSDDDRDAYRLALDLLPLH